MQEKYEKLSKFYLREKSNEPLKIVGSDDLEESEISITHPGVIEDLIKKSQEDFRFQVRSQIKDITKNIEYNFEKMYKNMNSKISAQNQKIDDL